MSLTSPPPRRNENPRDKLLGLIDEWTRIEVGLRTGFLMSEHILPESGLSLANDMVDKVDQIRKLIYGTSDTFELADKFGFKLRKEKR